MRVTFPQAPLSHAGRMDTWLWIAIVAVAALALVAVAAYWRSRQRTGRYRSTYGSEYDDLVGETGSEREARREIDRREKRVHAFDIRPLAPEDANRFSREWTVTQTKFVDEPVDSVVRADGLIGEVMTLRGYPLTDFEQQAADLSVDHPDLVRNYRSAHEIAGRSRAGEATTEELRRAMTQYRELFDELLDVDARAGRTAVAERPVSPADGA